MTPERKAQVAQEILLFLISEDEHENMPQRINSQREKIVAVRRVTPEEIDEFLSPMIHESQKDRSYG